MNRAGQGMNRATGNLAESLHAMRDSFDRGFAEPPHSEVDASEDFLAIRLGGDPYAVRLAEIGSVHRDHKVVPLVSDAPPFLGLASFRGVMAPVFALSALLGYREVGPFRWLLLTRLPYSVALAITHCDGCTRGAVTVASGAPSESAGRHVRGALRIADTVRPILELASLVSAIAKRAP